MNRQPWRTVQSNPFNKDKFKGNQEKINDWDLERTVYVYEPQSLNVLPETASELDYQKVWNKFYDGGHINIFLSELREVDSFKMSLLSVGASWDDLHKNEVISGYTNVRFGERPTKRFYTFEKLTPSAEALKDIEIFEDNNLSEVINNDGTFKQTTFTLNKFEPYDGGQESYYRDVKFYYGISLPINPDAIQIELDGFNIVGGIGLRNQLGEVIEKDFFTRGSGLTYEWGTIGNESGYDKILWSKDAILDVHFIVPQTSTNGVRFFTPWTWEYDYAIAQWGADDDGKELAYPWTWADPGGWLGTQAIDYMSPSDKGIGEPGTNRYDMTSDYMFEGFQDEKHAWYIDLPGLPSESTVVDGKYNKAEPGAIPYRTVYDTNVTGNGKELEFILPYGTELSLPTRLSSHGAGYVSNSSDDVSGLRYSDNAHNGARAWSVLGNWAGKDCIFAWDYVYNPGIFVVADSLITYLSRIDYGAFYYSTDYKELQKAIFNEIPIYKGNSFSSEFGILEDIKQKDVDLDIRSWNENDNDWTLGLMPITVKEVSKYYDSDISYSPSSPKIDLGLLDFHPATLQTNNPVPFFGKYLSEDKINSVDWGTQKIAVSFDNSFIGQLRLNYFAMDKGRVNIKFYIENELVPGTYFEVYTDSEINERSQGRNLSGGTIFTWL